MLDIGCTVTDDHGGLLARLTGGLDLSTVSRVKAALFKCLAEQPDALLVDVSALRIADELALTVFTTVVRQAAMWPGTPVLFCAPSPATAAMFAAAYRRLPLYATVQAARDQVRDNRLVLPWLTDELLPMTGAARQGRNVATEACVRWSLPHLVGPASLVAGELVTNAVVHAGTMMTLRLSLSRRYLHMAVRDGSSAEPVLGPDPAPDALAGRGLHLVDAVAASWGFLPTDGGKVVWATLATDVD